MPRRTTSKLEQQPYPYDEAVAGWVNPALHSMIREMGVQLADLIAQQEYQRANILFRDMHSIALGLAHNTPLDKLISEMATRAAGPL